MTADLAKLKEAAEAAIANPPKSRISRGDDHFAALAARDNFREIANPTTILALLSAHASALARVAVLEGALAGAIAADDTLSRLAVAEGHLDKLADTLSRLLDGKSLTHEQAISTAIVNLVRLAERAALRTEGEGRD